MESFTEQELEQLYYTKVKKPENYFRKYEILPMCPVNRWNYNWQNFDFPRNWCVLDFKEWIQTHTLTKIEHLGYTCESDPELEFIEPAKKTLLTYPPYDLHSIDTHFQNTFDFFLFNQTLEHLYNPYKAVSSIYQTIKPGGYVFTSVPTLNIPHMTPIHFGGFTPMGLAVLFLSAGFEIVETGQWGNFEYIQKLWGTHKWPGYDTLHHNNRVTNEEDNVCQCWILARKPL
jgi:SAM-dependent methyltransferase